MKKIIIIGILSTLNSCVSQKKNMEENINSPITTVIKLISAETIGNVDEALKYINLKSVYNEHTEKGKDYLEIYKKLVKFMSTPSNSKKFTNQFKYYDYDITEIINESKAKVKFVSKDKEVEIKEIIYSLDKINENWKITRIQYVD